MPQTDLEAARRRARALGVTVRPSTQKNKKLDVYDDTGRKISSIGDKRYSDYLQHKDAERRRLYKLRHEKYRKIKGSASYYADQILW